MKGDKDMNPENEVEVRGNHVKIGYPALAGSVIAIICAAFFVGVQLTLLRADIRSGVSQQQFQSWTDSLRERNEKIPLNVPPLPHHEAGLFNTDMIAPSQTRIASRK